MKRFIAGLTFCVDVDGDCSRTGVSNRFTAPRKRVPARWTTKVETKWRDVDIDAEIVTPDVETIPVMKVGYDLHHALLTPEESGWDEVDDTLRCDWPYSFAKMRIRENHRARSTVKRLAMAKLRVSGTISANRTEPTFQCAM